MSDIETFGSFVKNKRLTQDISLREFALKINISHSYLSEIESNIKAPPNDKIVKDIARVLQLTELEQIKLYELSSYWKKKFNPKNNYLPIDICESIDEQEIIKRIIRKSYNKKDLRCFWGKIYEKL